MRLDNLHHNFFRPLLTSLLVGALVATAVAAADHIEITGFQTEKRHWVAKKLDDVRARIEAELSRTLALARVIEIVVQTDSDLDQEKFEQLIKKLTAGVTWVESVILARDDIINLVFPYEPLFIGRQPLKDAEESGALGRARKERTSILYGPLTPSPGAGKIFISHNPIFLDTDGDNKREKYWGFIEMVLSQEEFHKEFDLTGKKDGLVLGVKCLSFFGSGQVMILGQREVFQHNPEKLTVKIPGGYWEIAALPENGWPDIAPHSWSLRLLGVFLSLLAGLIAWFHVNSPIKLRQKVDQATQALREAHDNLEQKIRKRTMDLEKANEVLSVEIGQRKKMEKQLLAHVHYLENIDRINKIIRPEVDLEVLLREVLDEILSMFGCDRAWLIHPCAPEAPFWRLVMECNTPDFPSGLAINSDIPTKPHMAAAFKAALSSKNPVILGQAGAKAICQIVEEHFSVKSQMMIALHPRSDQPWLLGIHQCSSPREWTETEKTLMKEIGRKISDVLDTMILLRSLKQSEEKFSGLLSRLNEAVFLVSVPDYKFEYFSPAAMAVFGYDCQDFLSGRLGLDQIIHPRFSNLFKTEMKKIAAGIVSPSLEYQIIDAEGDERWIFQTNTGVYDRDGRIVAMESCCINLTERKRAEEALMASEAKMRLIIESSPIGIRINQNGRLVYVNQALVKMFGYDSPEELLGLPLETLYPSEERPCVHQRQMDRLMGKNVPWSYEIKGLKKNGRIFDLNIFLATIDYNGQPAIMGFVIDVSAEKALRSQLIQAQKMEAVGTLAGGIAHDFNNILQVISGYVQLMSQAGELPPALARSLPQIDRAAERGAELVKSLLTFSRKVEIDYKTLDLNHEILQTIQILERTIPKMIRIETRLDKMLDPIHGDSTQLEQMIINLGTNARDAMPRGGLLLMETANVSLDEKYCRTHVEVLPGQYVLLRFSDTGQGMDPETAQHIFEPFYTTKKVGQGTGLGLSSVYGIVKAHGGHIICQSLPDQGTVFSIYLPAAQSGQEPESQVGSEGDPDLYGQETILLVDDEKAITDIAKDCLEDHGYTTLVAHDGETALEIYQEKSTLIDMVVLDLGMPGMGGQGCLGELTKINPAVKILIASGYAGKQWDKNILASGAKGFLEKPYRLKNLLAKVREILDGKVNLGPDSEKAGLN